MLYHSLARCHYRLLLNRHSRRVVLSENYQLANIVDGVGILHLFCNAVSVIMMSGSDPNRSSFFIEKIVRFHKILNWHMETHLTITYLNILLRRLNDIDIFA